MLPFYYFVHDSTNFVRAFLLYKDHYNIRIINELKHTINRQKFYCLTDRIKMLTELGKGNSNCVIEPLLIKSVSEQEAQKYYEYTLIEFPNQAYLSDVELKYLPREDADRITLLNAEKALKAERRSSTEEASRYLRKAAAPFATASNQLRGLFTKRTGNAGGKLTRRRKKRSKKS